MTKVTSIRWLATSVILWLAACGDDATSPTPDSMMSASKRNPLAAEVRRLAAGRGITPLERPAPVRWELVRLGRALAFDKILSGNATSPA